MEEGRHAPLLRALLAIQQEKGYLPKEEVEDLSRRERVPLYRLHGLATFFPVFRREPPPPLRIGVCRDLVCSMAGSAAVAAEARRLAGDSHGRIEVRDVPCLGQCDRAPAASFNDIPAGNLGAEQVGFLCGRALAGTLKELPFDRPNRPFAISAYPSPDDHYSALRDARASGDPAAVLARLKEAGLRGMGGAGFPTGVKWETVRNAPGDPKYVICNADESEPGTFKDRFLLDAFPHLVVEGMLLAAWAVGAKDAVVYLRHEYPRQADAVRREIDRARSLGLLNGVHAEIFVSPGGYICGEETALLEALEDKRAEPRNKPPFPATHGLHGQPTVINNVETFAWIPAILRHGPKWFSGGGINGCAGRKILGVSGDVNLPGVFEVPMGIRLRDLLDLAGGLRGSPLKAILPGGASSAFLPASMADTLLDFQALAKAGSMLGSGAVVAIAGDRDMKAIAHNLVRFFRDESCGKCVPCRVGTEKVAALLENGNPDTAFIEETGRTMAQASICGLGQAALNPVLSALRHFPI